MKKVLLITSHFPPSNLAGVHRSRLFVKHLEKFGWKPTVLTVHEKHYEEKPDPHLLQLVDPNLDIHKVGAMPVTRPRLIGDLGIRAAWPLYRKAVQLVRDEKIDFVLVFIPSFYLALLGRCIRSATGVPYGIDYIDPWVHEFPGSQQKWSRHWWSTRVASWLEPWAVKYVRLITGVAQGYYLPVLDRNTHLNAYAVHGAMPYGGEPTDHHALKHVKLSNYLFEKRMDKIQLVYAGAMLPKAYKPLERLFQCLQQNPGLASRIEFHFIGTGSRVNDPESFNIKPWAEKYGLWQHVVYEYPARLAYLSVLAHLERAGGVFILGSTEPHYTPSKSYQGVLSGKPILAVLHEASTAVQVLKDSGAAVVLSFSGEQGLDILNQRFPAALEQYLAFQERFDPTQVRLDLFEQYSAEAVTKQLAGLLNQALQKEKALTT